MYFVYFVVPLLPFEDEDEEEDEDVRLAIRNHSSPAVLCVLRGSNLLPSLQPPAYSKITHPRASWAACRPVEGNQATPEWPPVPMLRSMPTRRYGKSLGE